MENLVYPSQLVIGSGYRLTILLDQGSLLIDEETIKKSL